MNDPVVTSALAAAALRGVDVKITMTADSEWDHAFSRLARAGAHIRLYHGSKSLYIHAKVIVADSPSLAENLAENVYSAGSGDRQELQPHPVTGHGQRQERRAARRRQARCGPDQRHHQGGQCRHLRASELCR